MKHRIALFGAGLIGQRHAKLIEENPACVLAALVEPNDSLAEPFDVSHYREIGDLLKSGTSVDGAIIATPNNTHRDIALALIDRKIPLLIEKPLAASSTEASEIVAAEAAKGLAVLVGHHRRYHHASALLKDALAQKRIGRILGVQVTWCLRKPDEYFDAGAWRKGAGGGPVWINLIHEIDLLRHFLGDISEVTALLGDTARDGDVEDTGAISMRFQSGALATVMLSDASPSPWHFEGASGENPNIAFTGEDGLRVFGTEGSIAFPSLERWAHSNERGHWGKPIRASIDTPPPAMTGNVALARQLEHFCGVISGDAKPLVSAEDGLQNILVTEAILQSARTGRTISLSNRRRRI